MAADSASLLPYTVIDPDDRESHPYYVSPVHVLSGADGGR